MTLENDSWKEYVAKTKQLIIDGLHNRKIRFYNNELIKKLRTIYSGGIPASILLLSNGLCNRYCYDRALLLARAFFDIDDDISLLYVNIKSIRMNPNSLPSDKYKTNHCIIERITKDGKHLIYDTSMGFIYDKDYYWQLEDPEIKKVFNKKEVKEILNKKDELYPQAVEQDKYASVLWVPFVEATYGMIGERYAQEDENILKREVELYKNLIGYNDVVKVVSEDMMRLELRK